MSRGLQVPSEEVRGGVGCVFGFSMFLPSSIDSSFSACGTVQCLRRDVRGNPIVFGLKLTAQFFKPAPGRLERLALHPPHQPYGSLWMPCLVAPSVLVDNKHKLVQPSFTKAQETINGPHLQVVFFAVYDSLCKRGGG